MTSYLFRAPAGIAGSVTRIDQSNIEPCFLEFDTIPYGAPLKVGSNGKFRLFDAGSVANEFYGVLTRIAPAISNLPETYAGGTAEMDSPQGVIVRGYVNVVCGVGVPTRGYPAFVRVVDGGVGKPIGQFEATADGVNNVQLVGVTWGVDGKDSFNNAELHIAR